MSSREQFEAWACKHWPYLSQEIRYRRTSLPANDPRYMNYVSYDLQAAWEAWQASRQSLEVALPSRSDIKYMEYFTDVEGGCLNERAYLADLQIAIEAAGVRVKP